MGVDYSIGYGCVPKEALTTEGLISRVKAGERAQLIEQAYRTQGDTRAADEMGFEMIYRSADGDESRRIVRLNDLREMNAELEAYAHHCQGCPANVLGTAFGCIGSINYPISAAAEIWMLQQLPGPEHPVPFLLLKQGPEYGNTGRQAARLRADNPGVFFENAEPLARRFEDVQVSAEQLFELMFLLGNIPPKRAVMILLFLGGLSPEIRPDALMALTPPPENAAQQYPFLLAPEDTDDASIRDLKAFLKTLHMAVMLDRPVLLDV
ncbi:MAG: hypothetical protein ACLFTK_13955 [Anaerolineales bacterium]